MTERADIPLEEAIDAGVQGALLDLHTACPAIVKSYDAAKGTCDVQPAVKRALESADGSPVFQSYPVIPNVRVCWPGAGGFELHLPLAAGDTVLLVFSEVDTSRFEATGQESAPAWLERHGLHSPVAYPYNRQAKATSGGARLVCPAPFTFGVDVGAQFVALSDKVDAALDAIKTAYNTHTHISAAPGSPTGTAPPIPALPATAASKLKSQ